jgi:hypothetical protein
VCIETIAHEIEADKEIDHCTDGKEINTTHEAEGKEIDT